MRRTILTISCLALLCLAACKKSAGGDAGVRVVPDVSAKLAADLQLFATGNPMSLDEATSKGASLKKGAAELESYVDSLLEEKMGGRMAKDLIVSATTPVKDRHPLPIGNVLKTKKDDGSTIYYLRDSCTASEAVKVVPWWDDDGKEVLVCPSAYRPEVKGDTAGRTCGASMLDPRDSSVCGCGPMLVYCMKNQDQRSRYKSLIVQEVSDTAGYVVDGNLPIEQLFTMNESVNNEATEYLYRRARVVSGEDPKTLFPIRDYDKPKLRPRHDQVPGQQAGVLSAPMMMYASDALRGVMRNYYEYLWCTGTARSNVETEAVLALKKVDLRVGDGWKELASMNICTDCHARLDYGMQFFWGYPSSTMGTDFNVKNARVGKGPLYGDNIKDERGQADQTPRGFAELATAQPEFGACMTRKIVDHVYNGTATYDDFEAIRETFSATHRVKPTLKAAMLRYAQRELTSPTPSTPRPKAVADAEVAVHAAAAAGVVGAPITVTPALKKLIGKHCRECHDTDDDYPLVGDTLTEKDIAWILDRVAFGAMPKDVQGLPDETRRRFVDETTAILFADAKDRADATAYYAEMMRANPVHRFFSAMRNVNAAAGSGGDKEYRPSGTESAVTQALLSWSPGLGVAQGVTAMKACKDETDPVKREACVERATDPNVVMSGVH